MAAVGCRRRHHIIDYTASLAGIKDLLPDRSDWGEVQILAMWGPEEQVSR